MPCPPCLALAGALLAAHVVQSAFLDARGAPPPRARAVAFADSLSSRGPRALQPRHTFVGTTPCGELVRAFVGGMPPGEACHAIKWELTLGTAESSNRWSLTAVYGVPGTSNPGALIDGPRVTKQGAFVRSTVPRLGAASAVFRLTGDAGASIAFAGIGPDLVHLAGNDGSLVPGNSASSYTLTRADRVEPPVVEIARPAEGFYTVPPKEIGSHVFGTYVGRSPCAGLARELQLAGAEGCVRLKWRVQLLKDPATNQPTTYVVGNSLTRERSWTGSWRVVRGAPAFPDASVYQLDATTEHGPILLLRMDDSAVLFLNQQRQPLPGNADFTYTLTRAGQ
jgi:hypothetical protein